MNTATVGQKVDDILDSVVSSDFIRRLKPTMDELNNTMAQMAESNKLWKATAMRGADASENINRVVNDYADRLFAGNGEMQSVAHKISTGNMDASFQQLHNLAGSDANLDAKVSAFEKKIRQAGTVHINPGNVKADIGGINYALNMPKAYFSHPDKQVRSTRINTAIGAYAAATVGTRIMSGGNLTTDSYGRKDIAGVPFI